MIDNASQILEDKNKEKQKALIIEKDFKIFFEFI